MKRTGTWTLIALGIFALTPLSMVLGQDATKTAEFEKILESRDWSWQADGQLDGSIHFFQDGTAKHSRVWTASWHITGPRTVLLTDQKNSKLQTTLTFDEAGKGYWGLGFKGHANIVGWALDTPKVAQAPAATPPPVPPPSAALQGFFTQHLEQIFAPIDQDVPYPRNEVVQLRESFADGLAQATAPAKPQFQSAIAVCNALTEAIDEREKAVTAWHGSVNVHGPTDIAGHRIDDPTRRKLRREDNEQRARTHQAGQVDTFLSSANKTQWIQRAEVLRQNIQQLYARERADERAVLAVKAP